MHDHPLNAYLPAEGSKTEKPARIAWLVPSLIEGSGGHRTILQNISALEQRGHECHLYMEHHGPATGPQADAALADVREKLRAWFGVNPGRVHLGWGVEEPCDMVFATAWYSAQAVADLPLSCPKAYFVQDYEAMFMPMGDGYLMGENTFDLGLTPITIGRWLTAKLAKEHGSSGTYFDFCADTNVYRPMGVKRERAVAAIVQPEKPRRCPRLAIEALGIVKHFMPDVKVYIYGSKDPAHVWFEHTALGLLHVEGCNNLYNRCQVGLCISASNPSRVPFEMMASGLPVVDIHRENNLYDAPESAVLLAHQRPQDIARAIMDLLNDEKRRDAMSAAGVALMRERPLQRGYQQFVAAVEMVLAGRAGEFTSLHPSIEPLYHRAAVYAEETLRSIRPTPQDVAAAEAAAREMERRIAAQEELAHIQSWGSWRTIQRLKKTALYKAWAGVRYGPGWDQEPAEDPAVRLARLKGSRAYRMLIGSKQTGVYKWYAKRKYGTSVNGH